MLFNSYTFLWFLPLSLLLYWSVRPLRMQNAVLLLLSYVFYGWWDTRFLLLIAAITVISFVAGIGLEHFKVCPRIRQFICISSVGLLLCFLGAFKYYEFFAEELQKALLSVGLTLHVPLWNVVLPVGVSFFTFQAISYVIDVKRGQVKACHDLISFAVFIAFFPQLVAGPIERAKDLLPQMQSRRHFSYPQAADGMRLIIWGMFKKMVLADRCAPYVDMAYANPMASGSDLWIATLLFAFQIYGDFSGYSDVAIGTARLFGIRLTRNFALPFFSRNVPEIWQRWHISLMNWFKDYVYIPLGGSRHGRLKQLRNIAIVFFLSGLWHGANWTFVCWGLFQVLGFLPFLCFPALKRKYTSIVAAGHLFPTAKETIQMASTLVFFCIGWVFFRSENVTSACMRIRLMCSDVTFEKPFCGYSAFIPILFTIGLEWLMRERSHALDFSPRSWMGHHRMARWAMFYLLIVSILYFGGEQMQFIYFQF